MVKANELRIGNILRDKKGKLCIVETVSIDPGEMAIYAIKGAITTLPIEAIPLTENRMLSLGFKKIGEDYPIFSIMDGLFEIVLHKKMGFIYPKFWHKEIEHVHQLQNLYFALTGEELNTEKLCSTN